MGPTGTVDIPIDFLMIIVGETPRAHGKFGGVSWSGEKQKKKKKKRMVVCESVGPAVTGAAAMWAPPSPARANEGIR